MARSMDSSCVALNAAIWVVMISSLHFLSGEADATSIEPTSVKLVVDGRQRIASVGDDFICATLDWWPSSKCNYGSCPWYNTSLIHLDLDNPVLQQAVQALAPLKIRIGGTLQDTIEYDIGPLLHVCTDLFRNNSANFGYGGGCLPMYRWDLLNEFFFKTGASVAFGLNVMYGREQTGNWDSSNAEEFIKYTHDEGYRVTAWELGNELMGDDDQSGWPPHLYANYTKTLRTIVDSVYENDHQKPLVVAPDSFYEVGSPGYQSFLSASGPNVVDVVTRHMYNLGPGSTSTEDLVTNILSRVIAEGEEDRYRTLQSILEAFPWVKAWVGEAGGAYNSGHQDVTDSFIMAFWYLDQLGLASKYNNQAFCRQSLIGGHYGLLDATTYVPNPDFYGARLWQDLMGNGVLSLNINSTDIRAYAHCLKSNNNTKGGITVLLLNYSNVTSYSIDLSVLGQSNAFKASSVTPELQREFHMSPEGGDIHSHVVLLNGNPLKLIQSKYIPSLEGQAVNGPAAVIVEPLTYAFVALEDSWAPACLPQY